MARRKDPSPCHELNPGNPACSLVTTDRAKVALAYFIVFVNNDYAITQTKLQHSVLEFENKVNRIRETGRSV